jgi:hypothetical protein
MEAFPQGNMSLWSDQLDDLEKLRIASENRLREMTRSAEPDKDGEVRGLGLAPTNPAVLLQAGTTEGLKQLEHNTEQQLMREMRAHPMGAWVKSITGIGDKQGARLIAAIGDPFIRPEITTPDGTVEPSRPRGVYELYEYCGYGEDKANPRHIQRRRKGQKANWSARAKMRAYLTAEQCIKFTGKPDKNNKPTPLSPYRHVYEEARAKYADSVHAEACPQCGPAGKPAQPGSPLSDGHKHARALRKVAKEILKDCWREARCLHGVE